MPTEFVVRLNEDTYGKRQELPSAYDDFCYNGNKHVYLTSQERVRYRVQLVKPNGGTTELRGEKWKKFCVAYIPKGAYLLHFVQEGDDSFYVTSYDDLGYETGGYEGIIGRPCRFMCRVSPSDNIPQNIRWRREKCHVARHVGIQVDFVRFTIHPHQYPKITPQAILKN